MSDFDTMSSSLGVHSVRQMNFYDVPSVVRVHIKSFTGFFLSFLGPAFLRQLYEASVADPSGIGFVVENERGVCGFVTGTSQPSGFYRRLLKQRWWRFALASLIPITKRPSIIPRLVRAISMPARASQQEGHGTLMSLAVLPDMRGKGLGKSLVYCFLKEAHKRDLHQVNLLSDRYHNDDVNFFYQGLGFRCERKIDTPEGRMMNEYVIDVIQEVSYKAF
jgi:ribosomal protein S18 acetylase RimI-like enzyme